MTPANACTWQPSEVTTIDGRKALSDSEEWRLCCEAVHVLNMPHERRKWWLAEIRKRRGEAGVAGLVQEMERIEPAYMLTMPAKEDRRRYLSDVERHLGAAAKEHLEKALVAVWEQRKAAQAATA